MVMPLPSPSRILSALFPTTPAGASTGAELVTTDGRTLPLVASTLRAEAHGGIARFVLEQRFENRFAETLRVTYRMPLPADGAVSGYAFDIGERTIKGTVDRKAAARERFEQAIVSGRTAALLEQDRGDIFTQQIGNIPPGEAIVARITVDQRLAWLPEGEWELRFPTVIGPRYIGSADTVEDVVATHLKVTDRPLPVNVRFELAIKDAITGGRKASSTSHTLVRRADGVLELAPGARLDRDIVVRWPVATHVAGLSLETARPPAGPEVEGAGARLAVGDNAYGLLTIVPPASAAKQRAVPRDLIVLLDTSGSMGGGPLDKAKQVVAMLIDSLDEQDRFELIEFSSRPSRYQPEPMAAIAKAKQDAIRWVRSRRAEGGTEMRAAVSEALCTLRIGAQRQVVVVTDGYVGGEQQILEVLHHKLPRSCRLHVLGVGAAVNRSLATALARAGRGAEVIIGVDEDAERGAKRLLDRTRMPMLTNVEISGGALISHAPEHIPDVFEGCPLVAALLLKADGGELIVRGDLARDSWEQRIMIPPRGAGAGNQAIVTLYGRERVADLESRTMLEQIGSDIEALGLQFQIATRFTSWVAIDEVRRAVGPVRDALVPQEIPYGTRASAFGLRSGSSAMPEFSEEGPTGQVANAMAFDVVDTFDELGEASVAPPAASAGPHRMTSTMAGVYRGRPGSAMPPSMGPRSPAARPPSGAERSISPPSDDSSEPPGDTLRSISKITKDEALGSPPARQHRSTDVDEDVGEFGEEAPAEIFAEVRPPRPTEAQPMPQMLMSYTPPPAASSLGAVPRAIESEDFDRDARSEVTGESPRDSAPAAPSMQPVPPRATSPSSSAQSSTRPPAPSAGYPPESSSPPRPPRITHKTMSVPPPPPPADRAAGKPEPLQQPVEMAKRPLAPASRFVPFWLTVLVLAVLIALIAWWLAS